MLNIEQIGIKISELRMLHNLTQQELALKLFVTHQAVSKWEKGKSIPSIEILYLLTKLFNVSLDYIIDDSEIKEEDYETQFMHYPRKTVVSKFIRSNQFQYKLEQIFYLLTKKEREMILHLIISKNLFTNLHEILHIFSNEERRYILYAIVTKKYDYEIELIKHLLSKQEQVYVYNML